MFLLRLLLRATEGSSFFHLWEFPKIRGTLSLSPYNKDPTTGPRFRKLPFMRILDLFPFMRSYKYIYKGSL